MTRFPEEDCVEKMLLNAPSGVYTNYSPSVQVSKYILIMMILLYFCAILKEKDHMSTVNYSL